MAGIQESPERKLVRTLRELTAPHAISPEGASAIKPIVPLAEEVARRADEREQEWRAAYEREQSAHADAAALRAELKQADERVMRLEEQLIEARSGLALSREETRSLAASINAPPEGAAAKSTVEQLIDQKAALENQLDKAISEETAKTPPAPVVVGDCAPPRKGRKDK